MGSVPSSSRSYAAYRVTAAWSEAITWDTSPALSTEATSTTPPGTAVEAQMSWNVTTDLQAHVTTPADNRGWMLRDANEGGGSMIETTFRSREHSTTGQRPFLVVTYYP